MTESLVLAGGAAAIAWVNWYFLWARKSVASANAGPGGVQQIDIAVEGGYSPSVVRVQKGKPVRLVFDRREKSPCSEEVVISQLGVRRFLPPFERTAIEFTPDVPGAIDFACGMNMLRGRIEVEG